MGASSVTGVGLGGVDRTAKGPKERAFVGVEKIIGPRIVYALRVTLDAQLGTATVAMPFSMTAIYYGVLASGPNAVTVAKTVANGIMTGVTLTGTGGDIIDVAVMKLGQQGEVAPGVTAINQ